MALASAGDADLRRRIDEAHQAERAQAALGGERSVVGDGVALDRDQEVHRDRRHFELAQLERHLDDVGALLAHAEDQSAARLDAALLRGGEGAHAVFVGVRGADLAVVRLARVEVVVQTIEAGVGEDARVLFFEQPDGETHLDREAALHFAHRVRELARELHRRAAARHHHAITRSAGVGGALGLGEDRLAVLHRVLADRRVRVARLRAVAAVFGAEPVLHVVQHVHHDAPAEVLLARREGGLEQGEQGDVVAVEHPERVGFGRGLPGQGARGEGFVAFEHGGPPQSGAQP